MGNVHIREFIRSNETTLMNGNLSCSDILNLKETFYKEYGKKPRVSEAIIFTWLLNHLDLKSDSNRICVLKSETKYPAQFGNQTLDISIQEGEQIKLGISIKMSTTTSAYLDGADYRNPFLTKYRHHFVKDESEFDKKMKEGKRIGIPTLLQDMARIQNLKMIRTTFPSITIVFSTRKVKDAFWINEFENLGHQYIFLGEHLSVSFKEILTEKIPSITRWIHN